MAFVLHLLDEAFARIAGGDGALVETALRTLWFASLATLFALLAGLPLALWLADGRTRARRIGLTLANAGLGLPPVVLGVYLALLLLPASPLGGLSWDYRPPAVVLAQTLLALPIVVALSAAALRTLPPGLLEQARAFGASRPQRALLALREARVGLAAAVIATLGSALAEVGAVVIVGGNIRGSTNTLASTVLLDLAASDTPGAIADALVLVALLLLLALVLTLVQQGRTRDATAEGLV
ncbi:ABC transporter permease [Conexibacter sp. JD483]|uniref:ABC transporter permease n=1 Tax=unclassified Conexibacter TaxID=2627773 RepID=UPI00271C6301|nr:MULTISPECIES: ABC transporter permease [unclassified Conexibacter]MDO8186080.1 ABC transporter permease [Conexibacter sp. CPCC 205706]MDO8199570.1 ABC transporter permease [Conexibacter sp. CPCC 205762]MDR9373015.1 ABC transporter permease [Conexibacter sp. JD483]